MHKRGHVSAIVVAGFADAHYFVEKTERAGQTYATLTELDLEARVTELARMLSGSQVTDAALENAKQLLAASAGQAAAPQKPQ